MTDLEIPVDVSKWLWAVFRQCNERVTEKLCNNPSMQEEWLDLSWIEHLTRVSSPIRLESGWTVQVRAHYLGGTRQFFSWEVADIGVLLFVRIGGRVERSKVALLQSKRLYPSNMAVTEETMSDYEIGFARLADPEDLAHSIALEGVFEFDENCRYGALAARSQQTKAIAAYEKRPGLPIYYQLYNPWILPFRVHVPVSEFSTPPGALELGIRILPSSAVHAAIKGSSKGYKPSFSDMATLTGWPLEDFMANELLDCREGARFESLSDDRIQTMFNRRSGPIAAAISITVEAPEE